MIAAWLRIVYILGVVWFYDIDQLLLPPIKCVSRWLKPLQWLLPRRNHRGQRLRRALIHLGPIYVKFGQILSTRRDMLPLDIVDALATLQDRVPPFSSEQAIAKICQAYQCQLVDLFREFEREPLAAASVAQVHAGVLHNGDEVVVKVIRPQIRQQILRDVKALDAIAWLIEKVHVCGDLLRPREVVAEFKRSVLDELDLQREAANAAQIKRNFADSDLLYVHDVYWDYVTPEVMMMERVDGVMISDVETMRAQGVDFKRLAEHGVEIFFTQVFRDRFFHADMHPGNIFVDIRDPKQPRYMAVDFGIVGTLDEHDQRYLAENLLAFFNRDYHEIARLHVASGWVPPDTRIDQFEAAIRAVCEPIFAKPLSQISFGQLLLGLLQTARRFRMQVQPQLLLLQKTLFNIEALGRELYPDLDLWVTAKPFLEDWMKERMGWPALCKQLRKQLPYWLEKLPEMPELVYQLLQQRTQQPTFGTAVVPQPQRRRVGRWCFIFGVACGAMAVYAWLGGLL